MRGPQQTSRLHRRGFTLVELLIVVVVIAILAAITVVAYRGVSSNAQSAALKADLTQAASRLETYKIDNGAYPPDQTTAAGLIKLDPSITLTYAANNSTDPPAYCLTATNGTQQFSVGSVNNTPSTSSCVINLATDPAATANGVVNGQVRWAPLWFGGSGGGTTTLVTGAADGPIPGLSTYMRKTWTTAPTGSGNTGFAHTNSSGLAITVGTTYTISSYLRASKDFNGPWSIYLTWRDPSGSIVGATVTGAKVSLLAGAWTRLSVTAIAPAGATVVTATSDVGSGSGITSAWAVGDTLDGTGLMVTQGSTLYKYADGNSAGWSWTGTPNASASIGPPL